jgi:uncharacterized RDD family membrane protein YckC
MQWYYAVGDQRIGPVSEAQFEALVLDGTIRADTLVWKSGMANWQPYAAVQGAVPPPPPVSAPLGGTVVAPTPQFRAPAPQVVAAGQPAAFHYAGFWIRFGAKLIDFIILWIVSLVVNGLLSFIFLRGTSMATGSSVAVGRMMMFGSLTTLCSLAEGIAFSWFFISRFDATPGKMALGLKVLRADGSKLSPGRIVGRYFAEILSGLILCIGYIIAAFDDQKRALHDHLCETRVIKTK